MAAPRKKKKALPVEGQDPYAADKELYDWIQCLLVALIICVLLFVFFIRVIDVVGGSMNNTLFNKDKMLVSGLFYKPKVGDVVVFKKDAYDPNKALVKRVIAVEGQEINMDFANGIVYIDGVAIKEDYITEFTYNKLDFIGPKKVPEGCVFVMGDNRNMSIDSRKSEIGMLDNRLILGKAYFVIYPLSGFRAIK